MGIQNGQVQIAQDIQENIYHEANQWLYATPRARRDIAVKNGIYAKYTLVKAIAWYRPQGQGIDPPGAKNKVDDFLTSVSLYYASNGGEIFRSYINTQLTNNHSKTVTIADKSREIYRYEPPGWGDKYEINYNVSVVSGAQQNVNVNTTITEGKYKGTDVSINKGSLRVTVGSDRRMSVSAGAGNYRYGLSMSPDLTTTFSVTFRTNSGYGATTNYSWRPGGRTFGTMAVAAITIFAPELLPIIVGGAAPATN